eukprot:scaffold11737_cov147-Isochrysis_galbana.AAC.1
MMIIIILGGNVARKNGGVGLWHVGRLCLATAPLGLRMWTIHAAPWKGRRAVSSGGLRFPERGATFCPQHGCSVSVRECVKQASVTSFDAMQPSGCRGVQAGRQAEAGCRLQLRIALAPAAARRASRARAAGLQGT